MPKTDPEFSKNLIRWYLTHRRNLPWRQTTDPYHIWLSEIMLQQTRVAQGLPYYLKFVAHYPTVHHLAKAAEDEVLKLWQGLGYYSRARNLHATAKTVSQQLDGIFPNTYADLVKLKGVGDYTASAIASMAFHRPTAVVDGNVYRVLARVFGIATPINTTGGQKEFKALAQKLLDPRRPGLHNQALMEFGARQCTPKKPDCDSCPLNHRCLAFRGGRVEQLPVKLKSKPPRVRHFNYLVLLSDNDRTLLQQRSKNDIWEKLYEFPLIETPAQTTIEELQSLQQFQEVVAGSKVLDVTLYNERPIVHKLSHQHLYTHFYIVETDRIDRASIPLGKLREYAVPVLIGNFVAEFFENPY